MSRWKPGALFPPQPPFMEAFTDKNFARCFATFIFTLRSIYALIITEKKGILKQTWMHNITHLYSFIYIVLLLFIYLFAVIYPQYYNYLFLVLLV
jgi:hypothetical protein